MTLHLDVTSDNASCNKVDVCQDVLCCADTVHCCQTSGKPSSKGDPQEALLEALHRVHGCPMLSRAMQMIVISTKLQRSAY